jgi:hypothetical protein
VDRVVRRTEVVEHRHQVTRCEFGGHL